MKTRSHMSKDTGTPHPLLPFSLDTTPEGQVWLDDKDGCFGRVDDLDHGQYIVHACNSYSTLSALLKETKEALRVAQTWIGDRMMSTICADGIDPEVASGMVDESEPYRGIRATLEKLEKEGM